MWSVQKEKDYETWISDVCTIKIYYHNELCEIHVDYKGYNALVPLGLWGFEEEIQDRKIEYDVEGEKGHFQSLYYVVTKKDIRLFCDIVVLQIN